MERDEQVPAGWVDVGGESEGDETGAMESRLADDGADQPAVPTGSPDGLEAGDEAGDDAGDDAEVAPGVAPAPSPPAGNELPEDIEGRHLLELWSGRDEIHALPEILRPAEGLVAVGSGTVVRSGHLAQSRWLVVLTDRRLLCIKGRSATTRKVIDMPISAIRDVETKGWLQKTLVLDTGYGTLRIGGLKKGETTELVSGLATLMAAFSQEPGAPSATALRRADLSKAGTGGGHTHEEIQGLERDVQRLEETVKRLESSVTELTERVAWAEELIRSNVGSQ